MPAKSTKRKSRKANPTNRVDELVRIWQSSIRHVTTYGSALADQVTSGDFKLSSWMGHYTALWRGLAKDTGDVIQAIFPDKR